MKCCRCRASPLVRVLCLCALSLCLMLSAWRGIASRYHGGRPVLASFFRALRGINAHHGHVASAAATYWRGPSVTTHSMQFGVEFGDADYEGWFERGLFSATRGAYPVDIITDAFWHCERGLHIISRDYKRTPAARNHSEMRVFVADARTEPSGWRELYAEGWYVEREYESSAVGIFKDDVSFRPGGICSAESAAPSIDVHVSFAPANWEELGFVGTRPGPTRQSLPLPPPREANATFSIAPMRAGRGSREAKSRFAMCAIFSFNNYMLRMWADYWSILGVGTFYFFYNGNPSDIPALNATLGNLHAHVVWVEWPSLHWIDTDGGDITHGQPMAIVDCLERWRDEHEFFFFYDLDEVSQRA
jgi:hypothetical protein